MFIVHILTTFFLSLSPTASAQVRWFPRIPLRPGPVFVVPPYSPGYVAPGWNPGWAWSPWVRPPVWYTPYWQAPAWSWMPGIAPGVWQCVAFAANGTSFFGTSNFSVNQAAYNALWTCGQYTWNDGCYVPPYSCRLYP